MKFDLSSLPTNAIITSSHLSLFYADTNNFGNVPHESLTNSNESLIQQVIDPWNENTVTWNNQPNATLQNQFVLNQSNSGTQDYTDMDVTAMVQDMFATSNNGFLLKLTNEAFYARMIFASGDNPIINKHPQLEVCYTIPTAIPEVHDEQMQWSVYPNPTDGEFYVYAKNASLVEVFNSNGGLVFSDKIPAESANFTMKVNLQTKAAGIYCIRLFDGVKWSSKKIILK